jgi:hypothetical protein
LLVAHVMNYSATLQYQPLRRGAAAKRTQADKFPIKSHFTSAALRSNGQEGRNCRVNRASASSADDTMRWFARVAARADSRGSLRHALPPFLPHRRGFRAAPTFASSFTELDQDGSMLERRHSSSPHPPYAVAPPLLPEGKAHVHERGAMFRCRGYSPVSRRPDNVEGHVYTCYILFVVQGAASAVPIFSRDGRQGSASDRTPGAS